MTFRVHFVDGDKVDVQADTAEAARKAAEKKRPGVHVAKVKRLRVPS